jgi:hypothetical protein
VLCFIYFETFYYSALDNLQTLYNSWIIFTMFTLVLLSHRGGVIMLWFLSYSVLPFVLLRQKWGELFDLDRDCIFNRSRFLS